MVQQLITCTLPEEDSSLVSSSHVGQVITCCDSICRGVASFLDSVSTALCEDIYTQIHG